MEHDNSYKRLFSNPEMVRDLFTGFVDEPWVADIDFDTLEQMSGHYVTDDLRDRADDIIWRVNIKGQRVYVYILLEFQSSVDKFMAVRMMTYLGLLYQDLIHRGNLTAGGKLPPVFPIVLYNGQARWRAKRAIIDLIDDLPGALRAWAPQLRYFLLEINTIDESAQFAIRNFAAALMRLEKSPDPQAMIEAMSALVEWLKAPEQTRLQRDFTVWIRRVLLPGRLPGVTMPEFGTILEAKTMLAERVTEWTHSWKAEGMRQGLEQGLQQGIERGLQQGQQQGKTQLLQGLLEARFGPLPDWALVRLKESNTAEVERWSLRTLNQSSLQEVLN